MARTPNIGHIFRQVHPAEQSGTDKNSQIRFPRNNEDTACFDVVIWNLFGICDLWFGIF